MRVFLSGKADPLYGAWRNALLGMEPAWAPDADGIRHYAPQPRWVLRRSLRTDRYDAAPEPPDWPSAPNSWVLDIHEYTGPYRIELPPGADTSSYGTFHATEWTGSHGWPDETWRPLIANRCLYQLAKADLVFAYINRPDCYGTLIELGFARALGKFVYLAVDVDAEWDWTDYWFAHEVASAGVNCSAPAEARDHDEHIRELFRGALVAWTASREARPGAAKTPPNVVQSFALIAEWTSDPRVRGEAQRMLRQLV